MLRYFIRAGATSQLMNDSTERGQSSDLSWPMFNRLGKWRRQWNSPRQRVYVCMHVVMQASWQSVDKLMSRSQLIFNWLVMWWMIRACFTENLPGKFGKKNMSCIISFNCFLHSCITRFFLSFFLPSTHTDTHTHKICPNPQPRLHFLGSGIQFEYNRSVQLISLLVCLVKYWERNSDDWEYYNRDTAQ